MNLLRGGRCSNLYDGTTKQLRKFIGVVLWITGINPRGEFAFLTSIVLDILSIPASEASAERFFSCSENVQISNKLSMKDDLFKVGILFKMTHLFDNEPVYDDTFLSHRLPRAFDDMQHAYYAGFVCEYGVKKLRSSQNSI